MEFYSRIALEVQFHQEVIIIWIIEATSKNGERVYRTDRKRFPNRKWSTNIAHAYQYCKEEVAAKDCSLYEFGNPKVKEIDNIDKISIIFNEILCR